MEPGRPGYVLFVGAPFYGHLNPLVLQAAEMARRGWRAAVATLHEAMEHLERRPAGVDAIDLGPSGYSPAQAEGLLAQVSAEPSFLKGVATIAGRLNDAWPATYDGLRAWLPADRPDVMVVDYAAPAGVDAAEALGVPFVVNNADLLAVLPVELVPPAYGVPPAFANRRIGAVGRRSRLTGPLRRRVSAWLVERTVGRSLNALRRGRGLPPIHFGTRLRDRLVLVNSAFGLEYARPLPPLIQMTGPMLPADEGALPDDLARWLDEDGPVAYVNMGTLARPTDALVETMVEGLGGGRFRTLWAMRSAVRDALPKELPPTVRVESWLPSQLAVLRHPRVRAFVSHCGTNSVQESLAAGTPVVGIPMFGAQHDMALRLLDAGVGLCLAKHRVTAAELRAAVERVLADEAMPRRIGAIQASFRLAGGVGRAADLIESAAWHGVDHLRAGPRHDYALAAPNRP